MNIVQELLAIIQTKGLTYPTLSAYTLEEALEVGMGSLIFGGSSLLMVLTSFLIPEKEKLSIFRLLSASAIFALLAIAAK
jgi:hypothetical protein